MFDGPQSAGTKLIWLVNWMWRDSSVIPGGQQVPVPLLRTNLVSVSKQVNTEITKWQRNGRQQRRLEVF